MTLATKSMSYFFFILMKCGSYFIQYALHIAFLTIIYRTLIMRLGFKLSILRSLIDSQNAYGGPWKAEEFRLSAHLTFLSQWSYSYRVVLQSKFWLLVPSPLLVITFQLGLVWILKILHPPLSSFVPSFLLHR